MDMPPMEEVVTAVAEDIVEERVERDEVKEVIPPMAIVIVVVCPLMTSVMTSSVAVVSLPLMDSVVVIMDILGHG